LGQKFFREKEKNFTNDRNREEIAMTSCIREPAAGGEANERISIVDDDEIYRSLLQHAAGRTRGLECVGSYSGGVEALRGIPSSASDVVLMDIRMPGMDGFECTRQLKNVRPHLLIIMISGFDDPDTLAQAQEAGADAYWAKEDPIGRFFETLTAWLRRRKLGTNATPAPENFPFAQTEESAAPTIVSVPPSADQSDNAIEHQASSAEQGLWTDEPTVLHALQRIVIGLEGNFQNREDLLQDSKAQGSSKAQARHKGHILKFNN